MARRAIPKVWEDHLTIVIEIENEIARETGTDKDRCSRENPRRSQRSHKARALLEVEMMVGVESHQIDPSLRPLMTRCLAAVSQCRGPHHHLRQSRCHHLRDLHHSNHLHNTHLRSLEEPRPRANEGSVNLHSTRRGFGVLGFWGFGAL